MAGAPSTAAANATSRRPPITKCQPMATTRSVPDSLRDISVPAVTATAESSDSHAPCPPPLATPTSTNPANPTTTEAAERTETASP